MLIRFKQGEDIEGEGEYKQRVCYMQTSFAMSAFCRGSHRKLGLLQEYSLSLKVCLRAVVFSFL